MKTYSKILFITLLATTFENKATLVPTGSGDPERLASLKFHADKQAAQQDAPTVPNKNIPNQAPVTGPPTKTTEASIEEAYNPDDFLVPDIQG